MKWIILMLAAVVAMTAVQATPLYTPNTMATVSSGCYDAATNMHVTSTANITIYYPNQSIFVNNTPMTNFSTGLFNYSFYAPNETGLYTYNVLCEKPDGTMASGAFTFEVRDLEGDVLGSTGIILGLVALAAFLIYMGAHHYKRPDWNKVLGVSFYLAASWAVVGVLFILYVHNIGASYEPFLNNLYIAAFWVNIAFNLIYLILTVIDMISTSLQGVNNGKR